MEQQKNYKYRLVARIVLEAQTPLVIGSGGNDIYTDATIARDVNGLPYIPGTSIAGVIRHLLEYNFDKEFTKTLFGYQKGSKGQGSEIIFSQAQMIGVDGVAVDGLQQVDCEDDFYSQFSALPVRQHVRINHQGAAKKTGKFDEEVVYKGTRFCFEIELVAQQADEKSFLRVLDMLYSAELRFGGGSRKGFGKMKVVSCKKRVLDLTNPTDLEWYLNHSSNLTSNFEAEEYICTFINDSTIKYELTLEPEDFFLIGAGYGDEEADIVQVKENVVVWNNNKPTIKEKQVLIPASSIKGALAHRTAYHFNRLEGRYAENAVPVQIKNWTEDNEAVIALFGSADKQNRKRGNVLFEDIIEAVENKEKIFNHVAIDPFTGGGIEGALYQEKAIYGKGEKFVTTITLLKRDFNNPNIIKAFEMAIDDLCNGILPIGGHNSNSNGYFKGILKKHEN